MDQGYAFLPKAMGHHIRSDTLCSRMRAATYHWHAGCQNRTIFIQGATQDYMYQSLEEDAFSLDGERVRRDAQDRLLCKG